MHLTNTQFGLLVSAFFWTYTPAQLLIGWIAQRFNTYSVMAIGLALWAIATIGIGLTSSFSILLAMRILLGIGESVAFPCSSKLIAEHVPPNQLGKANSSVSLGLSVGPAFGVFVGGIVMARFGWRQSFIGFGLISLLWLVPWLFHVQKPKAAEGAAAHGGPSYKVLVQMRPVWGTSIGHFSGVYASYFVLSWMPLYLVKAHGFTLVEMAKIGGVVYLISAASALIAGMIVDRLITNSASPTRVMKTAQVGSMIGVAASMLICAVSGPTIAVGALCAWGVFYGVACNGAFAIGQTLAGPKAAGKWIGFQNFIANIAGIVGPIITGFIVDRTGQYLWAFVFTAAIALIGTIGWGVIVKRVEPVDWASANGSEH
jgi:MFS family permease